MGLHLREFRLLHDFLIGGSDPAGTLIPHTIWTFLRRGRSDLEAFVFLKAKMRGRDSRCGDPEKSYLSAEPTGLRNTEARVTRVTA